MREARRAAQARFYRQMKAIAASEKAEADKLDDALRAFHRWFQAVGDHHVGKLNFPVRMYAELAAATWRPGWADIFPEYDLLELRLMRIVQETMVRSHL